MTHPGAVLSGPTFAREVGAGLPTAMTIASPDAAYAKQLAAELSSASFRAYTSTDILGVEIGGAVKNALAVGAGLSDGLGFGANTRVALITRGLKEMTRLGVALGARAETFMGLAGLGDLVLTCTDDQSRNRRFGLLLASGLTPAAALAQIGQAVEGFAAARAIRAVAARAQVEMPLCEMAYRVLYEALAPQEAVRALMNRPIRAEEGYPRASVEADVRDPVALSARQALFLALLLEARRSSQQRTVELLEGVDVHDRVAPAGDVTGDERHHAAGAADEKVRGAGTEGIALHQRGVAHRDAQRATGTGGPHPAAAAAGTRRDRHGRG